MRDIRTARQKIRVGDIQEEGGRRMAIVRHNKKMDTMTTVEFASGLYEKPIQAVIMFCKDGSMIAEQIEAV